MSFVVHCVVVSSLSRSARPILNRCVRSIRQASEYSGVPTKIYLVSSGGHSHLPFVNIDCYIEADFGSGYGMQNNLCIERILAGKPDFKDYVMLINDDAWVERDFFLQLMHIRDTQSPDVVVPLIYRGDDSRRIDAFGMEIYTSFYAKDSHALVRATQWGTAACIGFSLKFMSRVWDTYGFFFNPLIHFYYEDIELGIRSFVLHPKIVKSNLCVAHHERSYSSQGNIDFIEENSYQNYLWTVFLAVPNRMLWRNWFRFVCVYTLLTLKFIVSGKIALVIRTIFKTTKDWSRIMMMRQHVQSCVGSDIDISRSLSKYVFRSNRGDIPIRL